MKRKGFCFKRAVSLLLAAVMIVTAAPQTSLTALAAEQGMTMDTPDVSENLDILTTEDGTGADGDESADVPSDDGAGVGSDEQAGDPDNADQSDNAGDNTDDPDDVSQDDDAGDSDETADPEEDMDDDPTADDESVTDNDLAGGISVFGNETEGGESGSGDETDEGPAYKGKIDDSDKTNEGASYRRLIIDESAAEDSEGIDAVLKYYVEQIAAGKYDKFNCVEFNMGSSSYTLKEAYINGAISIMDTESTIGYWIDYNFWIDEKTGVRYALNEPVPVESDIDAEFNVELKSHQGVKINAQTTEFSGGSVSVTYSIDTETKEDAFAKYWEGADQEDLRLLALDGDNPTEVIEQVGISYGTYDYTYEENETTVQGYGSLFDVSLEGMQAGQDYLITPLYTDKESVGMGKTRELTAGMRSGSSDGTGISDAKWTSLDESLITIEAGEGAAATLTAKALGEAYYCVTYQSESDHYLELHTVRSVATTEDGSILSYVGEICKEYTDENVEYRRLVINEGEATEAKVEIADILTYYAGQGEKFNCVEFSMDAVSSSETLSYQMKAAYINGAVSVMDTENEQIGYWIDYFFWNDADSAGVKYALFQPREVEDNLDVAFAVTPMSNQGVKINAKTAEFPAESVFVTYNKDEENAFAECLDGANEENLRLLALDEGVSPGVIEETGVWVDEYPYEDGDKSGTGSSFGLDIGGMQAGKDYLITPLYRENVPANGTKELTAGTRSGNSGDLSNVQWVVLNKGLISIDPAADGNTATLTAKEGMEEAYYYVTYQVGTDTYLELHEVRPSVITGDGKELNYVGEIYMDKTEENVEYRRLVINEGEAKEKNKDAEIADILTYYAEQIRAEKCEKFCCVEFDMDPVSSSGTVSFPMKKDDINGAVSVMDTESEIGYWIDYYLWNDADSAGVKYALFQPREAKGDLDATFTVERVPHQGVKINAKTAEFPAESVNVVYNKHEENAFAECLDGANEENLRLLALDDGVSPSVIEETGVWVDKYSYEDDGIPGTGSNFGLDIGGLQAGKNYLITPLYADGDVLMGTTKELTAGVRGDSAEGVSEAAWKALNEELISIKPAEGNTAALTAKTEMGEAYYYVTYERDSKEWLELHSVQVTEGTYVGRITEYDLEDGTPCRRLIINEWESRENNTQIADILAYYKAQIAAEKCDKFNFVEIDMLDSSYIMKKDYINDARSIIDNTREHWISYEFWNDLGDTGVIYVMSNPGEAKQDVDAAFTVERVPHQGVKINAKTTEFPAGDVDVVYHKRLINGEEERAAYAECWETHEQNDLHLLAWNNGDPSGVTESDVWGESNQFENDNGEMEEVFGFGISIDGLEAGKDYLVTHLYADREFVAKGATKDLQAGERSGYPEGITDVVWKSLDESRITIDPHDDAGATLTAKDTMGEAYYYVRYKYNGKEWFELHSVGVTYGAADGGLAYKGEIIRDKFEDGDLAGKPYLRLRIDETAAVEENKDKNLTPILKFYKDKGEKFNCVEFVINGASETDRVVKKDYINNARSVLDTENNEINYWIDYNFQKHEEGKESWEYTAFSLNMPGSVNADINANVTVTLVAGQGVKLKFPAVNFNAENVTVNFGQLANWDEIKKILEGAGGEGEWQNNPYCLFTLKSDQPELYEDDVPYNVDCDMSDKRFWVCDVRRLKANTEYLMVPVKNAESMNVGKTKELTPPAGATGITWKSYTPNVISINTKDGKSELSTQSRGEALYGVIYKESSVQKAQFYRMKVESELQKIDFLDKEIEMEVEMEGEENRNYLHVVCYPSDAGIDSGDLVWSKEPANSNVIEFIADEDGKMRGEIEARNPGTVTVTAAYPGKENLKATCTITVKGRLDWDDVADEADNMDLYAVSGCDTKLSDVKFPEGTESKWVWKNPNLSLAPYAGSEGHMFTAVCTRDGGWSGEHTLWVRMINVTGITMQSRVQTEDKLGWTDWNQWWVPTALEKDHKLSLGFWYNMDGINWNDEEGNFDSAETAAVEKKLAEKYKVEWSSSPNNLGTQKEDGTYEYTAAVSGTKTEKKTFTVSVKDKAANKVVWKASHTLTVTPNPLFDEAHWKLIDEAWKTKEIDNTGKLTGLTLKIKMSKAEYDKWKLKFDSLDSGILKLEKPTATEETSSTTVVKIPCTQKSFGRVWIKVTAQDDDKSSQMYDINLEDPAPTLLSAATQTINKASSVKSVPIIVGTSAEFPLAITQNKPDVSIQEVKSGGNDASGYFELTDVREDTEDTGVYRMNLGLKGNSSGVKAGNYAVKLKCKTKAAKDNEYTLSLTVKVTDVKPKVTFKQTKKVNLFYTDVEGAGTLQINTSEEITKVELKNYVDKNASKNADCHYEVKAVESGVYQIVRKSGLTFNEKLKKGTLEYTVKGYEGSFQTTFTVATENKAPVIVLSTKSDTLYPGVGYYDSWITMTDKATGRPFVPTEAWYKGKGQNGKQEVKIGIFGDPNSNEQISQETKATGANTYGLFVTTYGNIVSRLRNVDSFVKKADTINLELKKDNWSKPVAVSYKLQVSSQTPKLALGKATLTLNKNADVYKGQQERTTLRLKGFNDRIGDDVNWVTITGQDDKSKAELIGKDSSLAVWYENDCGDVVVRFNDNDIAAGNYKFKISVGKNGGHREYASTVLTVKIVDKTVKQSFKVTAKGSIDVLNREGTFISYTPKISNLTGTIEDGWLAGKDANLFECSFEDGKLIVRAGDGTKYSTKVTYEVHTVFRVQTQDWRSYEVSSDNAANAKPFTIKLKQGKPKLKATAVDGSTLYRQRNNSVKFRLSAVLGKQDVAIEDAGQSNYWSDLQIDYYDWENQIVYVSLINGEGWGEIRKNGTYKMKLTVRYRDKASDVKEAEIVCPIVVR